jgi:Domain of unknown function (DUF4342)
VHGKELADKIRELIHEGNVRRIIIKDESGHTFLEIPLTIATTRVVAAPILAAVGAIAALVSKPPNQQTRQPSSRSPVDSVPSGPGHCGSGGVADERPGCVTGEW